MKHNSLNLLLLCLLLFQGSCSRSQKPVEFIPLPMLNHIDTSIDRGKPVIHRFDRYLVRNYTDSKAIQKSIDSFVLKNRPVNINEINDYVIILYKESSETNVENIIKNPRVIDRHSQENDKIYSYTWISGRFLTRWKIVKGEIVEPKIKIQIENIPDL